MLPLPQPTSPPPDVPSAKGATQDAPATCDSPKAANGRSSVDPTPLKWQNLKEKLVAGGTRLNAAMGAGGQRLLARMGDVSSGDDDAAEDSSDEDADESWDTGLLTNTLAMPGGTAVTIRNQPAVTFVSVEEEALLLAEQKAAKAVRSKVRKMKKFVKKSLKSTETLCATTAAVVTHFHSMADGRCTDAGIVAIAAQTEQKMEQLHESLFLKNCKTNMTDQILEQVKPINDHAKMVSAIGKERKNARDRRIRLALGNVDVASEAEYSKATDAVRDFEETDRDFKSTFLNFQEHYSSQLGHMLRCYLVETASSLEKLAATLRQALQGTAGNYFLSDECQDKFKDFMVDPKYLTPAPPLFPQLIRGSPPRKDPTVMLKSLPPPPPPPLPSVEKAEGPITGIPLINTVDVRPQRKEFDARAYLKHTVDTVTCDSMNNFLLRGQLHDTTSSRALPPSTFRSLPADVSLMDCVRGLTDEYNIETDTITFSNLTKRSTVDGDGNDPVSESRLNEASTSPRSPTFSWYTIKTPEASPTFSYLL